jgi:hypothetical protein
MGEYRVHWGVTAGLKSAYRTEPMFPGRGELPVQAATKYQLAIKLRTAKALRDHEHRPG